MLARDLRADVGRVVARIALRDRRGRLDEPVEERVVHPGLDQQAGPGQADLARVVELVHRLRDDRVEIGVGERDEGRLPAQLERDRGQVGAGGLRHELAGRDGAGERDPVDAGVRDERGAGLLADPLDAR